MPAYWLTYRRDGDVVGVIILKASDLISARTRAAVEEIDEGATFAEGRELDDDIMAALSPDVFDRMLAPAEATALLDSLGGIMPTAGP